MIKINQGVDLIIFGSKGDLAKRKLIPALYKLEQYKKIHKNTRIIGTGRINWNTQEYIEFVKTAIKTFVNDKINTIFWKKLSARLLFCNIDVDQISDFLKLKKILQETKNIKIYYCAIPPSKLNSICVGLKTFNLNKKTSRIIIEKPLGVCLRTSKIINNQISENFLESQIFRIDHYLGKESILNLLSLRFANSFFLNNWNKNLIDHIQITVSEEVGIENRWNYFNAMGQMRDMVQNHLLQILTILAMSQPKNITSQSIRYEKVKILKSLRLISVNDVETKTSRGQYSSGFFQGKLVPSYLKELDSHSSSQTETFVSIKVDIDNDQWSGVPFYLRTGKRLAHKYSEIVIFFKKNPNNLFKDSSIKSSQNKLIIRLEPNPSIKISFLHKKPGFHNKYSLQNSMMEFNFLNKIDNYHSIDAYDRLLLESMKGIQSLFVSKEEIEESWKWIDSIIDAWKKNKKSTLQLYEAGTWGPKNSNNIINRDGRFWYEYY